MIQLPDRYFGYLLIQCADEERDETLNVGVLAFDAERKLVECRIAASLDRIERNLPNVPVRHVRLLLEQAQASAECALDAGGPDGLAALSEDPHGSLRFTALRSIRGGSLHRTADDLLRRFVEMPPRAVAHAVASGHPTPGGTEYTSRRVIRSVETRLRRHDLQEGRDYQTGVTINARTANRLTLPVWFPLRIRGDIYLDGLEVKAELNRTLDISRAIALKVAEAHRAEPRARMNVLIRDPERGDDGQLAETVITEGAGDAAEVLSIMRYDEPARLDEWVQRTVAPEFAL